MAAATGAVLVGILTRALVDSSLQAVTSKPQAR